MGFIFAILIKKRARIASSYLVVRAFRYLKRYLVPLSYFFFSFYFLERTFSERRTNKHEQNANVRRKSNEQNKNSARTFAQCSANIRRTKRELRRLKVHDFASSIFP